MPPPEKKYKRGTNKVYHEKIMFLNLLSKPWGILLHLYIFYYFSSFSFLFEPNCIEIHNF